MRILLVSQEFPPETHWGGIGTYMGIIAPALVRAGAEVHVLSVVPNQPRSKHTTGAGVVVHRVPLERPRGVGRVTRLRETWNRLTVAWGVARAVDRLDPSPDVIECPSWNAEGLLLARRRTAPLAVHVFSSADDIIQPGPVGIDRWIAVRLEHDLIARADVVLSPPAQMAKVRNIVALDSEARVEIDCPVEPAEVAPYPEGPPVACFVGRFEARKAPETLLRAWPLVLERVPDARLVLSGRDSADASRPSYRRWLEDLAESVGVARSVEIVDRWGDQREVVAEMSAATVIAVPSRWESFGYVAAEAHALGRPVVASRLPALAGVVVDGETGRLVEPDDPAAWADALADLLRDPVAAVAMGRAGSERVLSAFDPGRVAARTLEAYDLAVRRYRRRVRG